MVPKLMLTTDGLKHLKIRIKLMKGKTPKEAQPAWDTKKVELKKSKGKLSTLQNALQVKREFKTIVRNGTRGDFFKRISLSRKAG